MERVYSSQNTMLVDNLKNALEAEEIECIVKNRQLSGAAGEVPPIEAWLELWVLDDENVERARSLVAEAADGAAPLPLWRCEKCGEEIPGELGACWKCSRIEETAHTPEPLPGGLLYRTAWRRMTSTRMLTWLAMAGMLAVVLWMLRSQ